jgi:hypothetical protein
MEKLTGLNWLTLGSFVEFSWRVRWNFGLYKGGYFYGQVRHYQFSKDCAPGCYLWFTNIFSANCSATSAVLYTPSPVAYNVGGDCVNSCPLTSNRKDIT